MGPYRTRARDYDRKARSVSVLEVLFIGALCLGFLIAVAVTGLCLFVLWLQFWRWIRVPAAAILRGIRFDFQLRRACREINRRLR